MPTYLRVVRGQSCLDFQIYDMPLDTVDYVSIWIVGFQQLGALLADWNMGFRELGAFPADRD